MCACVCVSVHVRACVRACVAACGVNLLRGMYIVHGSHTIAGKGTSMPGCWYQDQHPGLWSLLLSMAIHSPAQPIFTACKLVTLLAGSRGIFIWVWKEPGQGVQGAQ